MSDEQSYVRYCRQTIHNTETAESSTNADVVKLISSYEENSCRWNVSSMGYRKTNIAEILNKPARHWTSLFAN